MNATTSRKAHDLKPGDQIREGLKTWRTVFDAYPMPGGRTCIKVHTPGGIKHRTVKADRIYPTR